MKKEEGEMTARKKKWRREAKLTKNQRQATKEARTEQMKGMQENDQVETPTGDDQVPMDFLRRVLVGNPVSIGAMLVAVVFEIWILDRCGRHVEMTYVCFVFFL